MTIHQILILVLSALLFGMLALRDYRKNKKDMEPLQGDEKYQCSTIFTLPDKLWPYLRACYIHFVLPSWQNYLLCFFAINTYALGGIEGAAGALALLVLFHARQIYRFASIYRGLEKADSAYVLLSEGVCSVINPNKKETEEFCISRPRTLNDFVITHVLPWSEATHVHIYDDCVMIESEDDEVILFYYEREMLDNMLRAIAPYFKKTTAENTLLDFEAAQKLMEDEAGLAEYLCPYGRESDDRPAVTSQMGGQPNMPSDMEWPQHNGQSMSFLAQIKISETHDTQGTENNITPVGKEGMLYFFADLRTPDRTDPASYKVLYLSDEPDAPFHPFPDDLPRSFRFIDTPVVLNVGLGFFDFDSYDYCYNSPATTKATYNLVINNYLQDYQLTMGHMFGGAQWEERSPCRNLKDLQVEDILLLQLESFDNSDDDDDLHPLQLGRQGSIMFFYIREADLKKRDFSHVMVDWQ